MMRWVKRIGFVIAAIYFVILAALFFGQRSLLYHPPANYLSPAAVGLTGITEIDFRVGDTDVTAWWHPPADGKPVIMFFHGNGSAVYSSYDIYGDLIAEGYGVLGAGYAGYPTQSRDWGQPSQSAIMTGIIQQRDWLTDQGFADEDIIYFGTSLGVGVAAQLAKDKPPSMLIAEAPFNSMLDMGRKLAPFLPVRWLLKDQYRSNEALAEATMPLIWIHGTNDQVVPISQGQKLYDGYEGPKSAHIIEGGRHNNLWFLGGRERVLEALAGER